MNDSIDNFEESVKIGKRFCRPRSHSNKENKRRKKFTRVKALKSDSKQFKISTTEASSRLNNKLEIGNVFKSKSPQNCTEELRDTVIYNGDDYVTGASKYFANQEQSECDVIKVIDACNIVKKEPTKGQEEHYHIFTASETLENSSIEVKLVNDNCSHENEIQGNTKEIVAELGNCALEVEPDIKTIQCPVCFIMFTEAEHTNHVRSCFAIKFEHPGHVESCHGKDISHMNSEKREKHINRCFDSHKPNMNEITPAYVCPLCGLSLKTDSQKLTHLKRCSKKMGLEPHKVMEASKLFEKQLAERKALGLPALQLIKNKNSPQKRHFAVQPRSRADNDLQMALALSASMENKEDYDFLPPQLVNQKKKWSRKKNNRLPDCLQPLFLQTDSERLKLLEQKVAALIFPQTEESECLVGSAIASRSSIVDDSHLWKKTCTLECNNFYVPDLSECISMESVKAEKNLKNKSQIIELKEFAEDITNSCLEGDLDSAQPFRGFYLYGDHDDQEMKDIDKQRSLASDMKQLVGNPYLADLSIKTADDRISVHKLILSIRCPELFQEVRSVSEIDWSDIANSVILEFLECIYTGSYNKNAVQGSEHQLLKLVHRYKVHDLFRYTESLKQTTDHNVDNVGKSEGWTPKLPEGHDPCVLSDNEIEEIYQYSQSQQCLSKEKNIHSSSSLDNELINCLLDEDSQPNTSQEQPERNSGEEVAHEFQEISSPELFSESADRDETMDSSSDDTDCQSNGTFSQVDEHVFSSSPKKYTPIKSCSRTSYHNLSPIKTPDYISEAAACSSNSFLEQRNYSVLKRMHQFPLSQTSILSSTDSETVTVLKNAFEDLGSDLLCTEKRTPNNTQYISQHDCLLAEQNCNLNTSVESRHPSTANNRKRNLLDATLKTPKRKRNVTMSPIQPENKNNYFDDDIWTAFENECCIEVKIESSPTMEMPNLPEQNVFESRKNLRSVSCKQLTQPTAHFKSDKLETLKPECLFTHPCTTKTNSPVTPLPDYQKMITPDLREALKKYGVRKLPRSKAVRLLHHIYELTHPLVSEDGESEKVTKAIKSKEETKFKKKKVNEEKASLKSSQKEICKKAPKVKSKEKDGTKRKVSKHDLLRSFNSSSAEMPEESATQNSVIHSHLKKSIKTFLTSDNELHEKILLYEPIAVDEFHKKLKQNEVNLTMQQLISFLDEQCITFSMPRGEKYRKKQQVRNQKFRKRVLSRISKDAAL